MTRHKDDPIGRTREEKESKYGSTSGMVKNVTASIGIIVVVLAIFGYVFTFGRAIEGLGDEIDRNCRFLAIVEADTRFIIIEHSKSKAEATAFKEIFQNSIRDTCG